MYSDILLNQLILSLFPDPRLHGKRESFLKDFTPISRIKGRLATTLVGLKWMGVGRFNGRSSEALTHLGQRPHIPTEVGQNTKATFEEEH